MYTVFGSKSRSSKVSGKQENKLTDRLKPLAMRTYLVGKADASTKADTTNDEHGKVLGKGTQDGANAEGSSPQNHDQLPATDASHRAGEEAEESSCNRENSMLV